MNAAHHINSCREELMRKITTVCCSAALAVLLVPAAYAQDNAAEAKKLTEITFSAPIQVPGVTLPAGTYTFQTAEAGDHIVQIFDKDRKHIFATVLTLPNDRLEPTDKTVVMFSERPADVPQAVRMWYYPGNSVGEEFIYPRAQAMAIAKAYNTSVLASEDEKVAKGSQTSRVGENATGLASNEPARTNNTDSTGAVATSGTILTTPDPLASSAGRSNSFTPQSNSSTPESNSASATAQNNSFAPQGNSLAPQGDNSFNNSSSSGATATTGFQRDPAASTPPSQPAPRAARRSLPRTASDLSGLELLSALSIAAAFALMGLRKYQATKHTA
jgi:hypothetical protein